MAAPHVTGVIGLMRSVNPTLGPELLEDYLVATATPCAGCPAGRVHAENAVRAAATGLPPAAPTFAPSALAFAPRPVATTSAPQPLTIGNAGALRLRGTLTAPPGLRLACASPSDLGCRCTSPDRCTVAVAPGATTAVQVTFAPVTVGAVGGLTLTYATATGPAVASLGVTASATFPISVHAGLSDWLGDLSFAGPIGYGTSEQGLFIANEADRDLHITGHTSSHPAITVRTDYATWTLPVGGGGAYWVRCTPTAPGLIEAEVRIVTQEYGPLVVPVRCTGIAPTAVPVPAGPLDFGDVRVGASRALEVEIHNHEPRATLNLALVNPPAPFAVTCLTYCPATTSSAPARVRLTFAPLTPGEFTAEQRFTIHPSLPELRIAVRGRGVP